MGFYDDRSLSDVSITNMGFRARDDEAPEFQANIELALSGPEDDVEGPGVLIEIGFPASPDTPLSEAIRAARDEAIDRAHDVIQRLARLSREEIREALSGSSSSAD